MTVIKRAARRLQKDRNVSYSTALRAVREVSKTPDFGARLQTLKAGGLSAVDAVVDIVNTEWKWKTPWA